jgi:hypothetical protein
MTGVDRAIRVSTAVAVLAVAGVAAYVSYWHAYAVVCAHGETGITARLEPATIDGLVYASSMVNLYAVRHRLPVPALARWLLALGIVATLAANMAQGWSHGPVGAIIAAWPAVSLVGSYELLVWIIRIAAAGGLDRGPRGCLNSWYADHPANGRTGASLPEATPDSEVAQVGLVPDRGNGPQVQTREPAADQRSGPSQGIVPDHADQDTDQIRAGSGQAGTVRDESETIAAAVAAYRASLQTGKPLSERKLAGMFGKTSRRWARSCMAEARQSLAPAWEGSPGRLCKEVADAQAGSGPPMLCQIRRAGFATEFHPRRGQAKATIAPVTAEPKLAQSAVRRVIRPNFSPSHANRPSSRLATPRIFFEDACTLHPSLPSVPQTVRSAGSIPCSTFTIGRGFSRNQAVKRGM